MSDFDRHGSHLPYLIKAIQSTNGHRPVLELGMGWNSTPVIHWLCAYHSREAYSIETDPKWAQQFMDYQSEKHHISYVENWEAQKLDQTHWGVVLIDMRPALQRHKEAIRLANHADIVILHDTEEEIDRFYAYRRVWEHYKYRYDSPFVPRTTVLSNSIDVKELFI